MAQKDKLTTAQQNLLRQIQRGLKLRYMSQWWIKRCDTGEDCTGQVRGLLEAGMLQEVAAASAVEVFVLTEEGREWKS